MRPREPRLDSRRPEPAGEGESVEVDDPLAELRESLAEVPLSFGATRVLVVTSDPRHYRALDPEWRQRGWEVHVTAEPVWPEGPQPALVIVHLPAYGTLAGQGENWLNLVRTAASSSPAVPVVWVGGLADASLRHKAILAGASFLLPAPAGDVGETARWFREEIGVIAERLMSRLAPGTSGEAEAFRDFFLALHVDATPAEARASLLRFASSYFARGTLLAVRENAFESLGSYGLASMTAVRLPRGAALLEDVVVNRRPLAVAGAPSPEGTALAVALGYSGAAGGRRDPPCAHRQRVRCALRRGLAAAARGRKRGARRPARPRRRDAGSLTGATRSRPGLPAPPARPGLHPTSAQA